MSFFLKITITFVMITVITIFATSGIIINVFSNTIIKKESLLGAMVKDQIVNYSHEKYNRFFDLTNYIESSGGIAQLLANIDNDSSLTYEYTNIKTMKNSLNAILASDNDFMDAILITNTSAVYSSSNEANRTVLVSYDYFKYKYISDLLKSDQSFAIVADNPDYIKENTRKPLVSFIAKIYDPSKYPMKKIVGIFIINIATDTFQNKFLDYSSQVKGELTLINSNNQILFSFNRNNWGMQYRQQNQDKEDNIVSKSGVGLSGMSVISEVSSKILWDELKTSEESMILLILGITVLSIVIIMFLFEIFDDRIKNIVRYMSKVQKGNFGIRIPIHSNDELGMLSQSFNEMCEKLESYINHVYYGELRRKNAEINMLQAQINPHFLFNTLETIRMKAHNDGNEELATMTELLGTLFRWNVKSKEKIISVAEELEYITTYLQIQQYRFSDIIEYEIDIPDEMMELGIPKLIIQPIVENAFAHGFDGKSENCKLAITGCCINDTVEITIVDNGKGIDEVTLHKLQEEELKSPEENDNTKIGILNVHQRLRLIFGKQYGVTVESKENVGTKVIISYPALGVKEMKKLCEE